jgi:uncharacterized protein (TIGR02271 family)
MASRTRSGPQAQVDSSSRVVDTSGAPVTIVAVEEKGVRVRMEDDSELLVSRELFTHRDDESFCLPFSLNPSEDGPSLLFPVYRESLHVATRMTDSGAGVRVHKTVHTRDQEVTMSLAHDELEVERVAIGEVVGKECLPQARQEGETWIIPVLEEHVVVQKHTVLKEELRITRRKVTVAHKQKASLRREKLKVERFGKKARQE